MIALNPTIQAPMSAGAPTASAPPTRSPGAGSAAAPPAAAGGADRIGLLDSSATAAAVQNAKGSLESYITGNGPTSGQNPGDGIITDQQREYYEKFVRQMEEKQKIDMENYRKRIESQPTRQIRQATGPIQEF